LTIGCHFDWHTHGDEAGVEFLDKRSDTEMAGVGEDHRRFRRFGTGQFAFADIDAQDFAVRRRHEPGSLQLNLGF
jgi:hypothetical protein